MPKYGEAIADITNKDFSWIFGSFFADVLPRYCKLKISEMVSAFYCRRTLNTWILKAPN